MIAPSRQNKVAILIAIVLITSLLLVGCDSYEEETWIDDGRETFIDPTLLEFRQRQFLRFFQHDSPFMSTEDGVEKNLEIFLNSGEEVDPLFRANFLDIQCAYLEWIDGDNDPVEFEHTVNTCPYFLSDTHCAAGRCEATRAQCRANLLLDIASQLKPTTWRIANGKFATIPPQSRAVKAALREAAYREAIRGILSARHLLGPNSLRNAEDCLGEQEDAEPLIVGINAIRDLWMVQREAQRIAAEDYVSLADFERGKHTNVEDQNRYYYTLRTHAAAILLGSNANNMSLATFAALAKESGVTVRNFDVPLCPDESETVAEAEALQILRQAGLPPAMIVAIEGHVGGSRGTLSISQLLEGEIPEENGWRPEHTVVKQLSKSWGRNIQDAAHLFEETGLTLEDFKRARYRLAEEIRTYHASISDSLMIEENAPGGGSVERHVVTSLPLTPAPGAIYTANHIYRSAIDAFSSGNPTLAVVDLVLYTDKILHSIDDDPQAPYFITAAKHHLKGLNDDILKNYVVAQFGWGLGEGNGLDAPQFATIVTTLDRNDLYLTNSADDFRCAIEGGIHGVSCASELSAGFQLLTPVEADAQSTSVKPSGANSFTEFAEQYESSRLRVYFVLDFPERVIDLIEPSICLEGSTIGDLMFDGEVPAEPGIPTELVERRCAGVHDGVRIMSRELVKSMPLYVAERKPGAVPGLSGSYSSLAGMQTGGFFWYGLINRQNEARAGEILQPAASHCAAPMVQCGKFRFDERLPLENETTADYADPYESSWKRYLSLADQAAREADLLGRQALESSLQMDSISEAALSELQQLCGASVNLDPLASLLSRNPDRTALDLLFDQSANELEESQLARLRACLSDETLVPYVTLGDRKLCGWTLKKTPESTVRDLNSFCQAHPSDTSPPLLPCPRAVTAGDAGECQVPDADRYMPVLIGEHPDEILGYFAKSFDDSTANPLLMNPPCEKLREFREKLYDQEASDTDILSAWSEAFGKTGFFTPENASTLAPLVSWEAEFGSHSRLLVGGIVHTSTGDIVKGPSDNGICGAAAASDMCPTSAPHSLLCNNVDCDDVSVRAALNVRIAKAAILARYLGGASQEGFIWPDTVGGEDGRKSKKTDRAYHPGGPGEGDLLNFYEAGSGEKRAPRVTTYRAEGLDLDLLWVLPSDVIERSMKPTLAGNFLLPRTWANDRGIRLTTVGADSWGRNRLNANRAYIVRDMGLRALRQVFSLNSVLYGTLRKAIDSGDVDSYRVEASLFCQGESCYAEEGRPRYPWHISDDVRLFFSSDESVELGAMLDGLELLCEAAARPASTRPGAEIPDTITPTQRVEVMVAQLDRYADQIEEVGARAVLINMPKSAIDVFRVRDGNQAGAAGGSYGHAVAGLRRALVQTSEIPLALAAELRGIARDIRRNDEQLRIIQAEREIYALDYTSTLSEHISSCIAAIADAMVSTSGADTVKARVQIGSAMKVAAVCANSAVQISVASKRLKQQHEISDAQKALARIDLEDRMDEHARALTYLQSQAYAALEELDASLYSLEMIRMQARDAFATALFLDEGFDGGVLRTNITLKKRLSTDVVLYERARDDAIRMSFLAKRAIEQRFGISLDSVDYDMTLVEAPATWASSVCTLEGINYAAIREGGGAPDFADEFIGEYVRRLKNFVEAYNTDHPFQDGSDRIVVSLRDDVKRITDACLVPSHNLLTDSNDLIGSGPELETWETRGCTPFAANPAEAQPNCLDVAALDENDVAAPFPRDYFVARLGEIRPFRITAGPQHPECVDEDPACPCDTDECGWNANVVHSQWIWLSAGRYRVSWYGQGDTPEPVFARREGASTEWNGSNEISSRFFPTAGEFPNEDGWTRHWFVFHLSSDSWVEVGIHSPEALGEYFDVGGLMVENVSALGESSAEPQEFAVTDVEGMQRVAAQCEDTDGDVFRARGWKKHCTRLCPSGFGGSCPSNANGLFCYYETEFYITQEAIDARRVLGQAGFAYGNFNYRIDTLGLNVVGGAARQCANTAFPSTCYNVGYIPFSLEHRGPFVVRNHFGEDFRARLFPGRIEFAKALAAERYLTNPLSAADESLMSQYMRREFQGRPLTGQYILRIWEQPGVNFEGIEDVQVVLNYRYWTRQN